MKPVIHYVALVVLAWHMRVGHSQAYTDGEYDYGNYQAPGGEPNPMGNNPVGNGRARRMGMVANAAFGIGGFVVRYAMDKGQRKQLMKHHKNEKEHLMAALTVKKMEMQQLQYMVQQYEYQIHELQQALYESESEALQRDYDEFKAPDLNNDDVISRSEFGTYIRNYMKAYPQIAEHEYPTFDDFDMNRDGLVTFQEWQEYLKMQQEQEKQQAATGGAHQQSKQQQALAGLYEQGQQAQGFQSLYEQISRAQQQQKQVRR